MGILSRDRWRRFGAGSNIYKLRRLFTSLFKKREIRHGVLVCCVTFGVTFPLFSGANRSPDDDLLLTLDKYQKNTYHSPINESSRSTVMLYDFVTEVNEAWTGQIPSEIEHIQLLDEIEFERSALLYDLGGYSPQTYIFNDDDVQEKIMEWRRDVYRSQNLAKIDTLQVLPLLETREMQLYLKMAPYVDRVCEISQLTGLDYKIYLSLFWAETNLNHFSYSSHHEKWGVVVSPKQAWGISQVTDQGFTQIDRDYTFYRSIPSKRDLIVQEYARSKSIESVIKNVPNVGYYYVRHVLQKMGYQIPPDTLATKYAVSKSNMYRLQFTSMAEAKAFDSEADDVRLILEHLIETPRVDRERYKTDPLYAINIGCAYFYLDYTILKDHSYLQDQNDLIEACIMAYNGGRHGLLYRMRKHKKQWDHHKHNETRIHWARFQDAYQRLTSIETKFAVAHEQHYAQMTKKKSLP